MKKVILFATLACMMSCNDKTAKTPAIDPSNFDLSVAPNEDFYQYATGGWQAKNPLKPEFSRFGSFDVLRENNEVRINDLFQEMTKIEAAPGSVDQKISDLYKMGLDSVRLNKEGAKPVKADLAAIMQVEKGPALTKVLTEMMLDVGNPLFAFGVMADLMDSNTNAFYLEQSGLGMGNRDYYLEESNAALKKGYEELLAKLFVLSGTEEAEAKRAAADVVAFETELARASWSNVELRDIARSYNPMSVADLKKRYDAIDWEVLFDELGKVQVAGIDRAIVGQPSFFEGMNKLVKQTPIETLRYYLAAQYLTSAASYLSDDFYAASFDFFGRQMAGKEEQRPRWKRAMSIPNSVLGEAVGEMYVAKYFPAKDKERMLELVGNLQTALGEHIAALDWMSDATKAKAQEKLASFHVKIGYPDKWKDYSTLTIDPSESYWQNIKAASLWGTLDNLRKFGKPVDKDEWLMSPQTVNAYYNPTTNEICFPAAILQPPFYNPDADDAVNYGAIGVVIGHEMTHGFDDQGRNFDKDGNMNNWWTEEDAAAFKAKTDILVKQFDAIEVLPAKGDQPALFANGALCLGENIADQGGLRVAYTAYHNSLEGKEKPAPIDGFTPEQRFYLAYAQLWAQNIRDEEIARLTKLDVHSLGKWRVDATLRNLQDFYDAFSITDGAMYMPVEERVIIWYPLRKSGTQPPRKSLRGDFRGFLTARDGDKARLPHSLSGKESLYLHDLNPSEMKRILPIGILLMLSYSLSAFGTSSPRPAGMTVETCTVDGLERTYRLYLPEGVPDDAPLVFVLHGYGGNFNLDRYGMNEAADRHGFAVCYPQGMKDGRGKTCWNVGYPFQADMTVDDVSFLCELAGLLQDKYGLSRKNTFCTGMSNGGEMCYLLAYSRPDVFAAVAPVSGLTLEWMYRDCDTPAPIPLFEIHGTEDRTSAWEGDLENKGGWGAYLPVEIAVGYWVAANRCVREQTDTLALRRHPVVAHRFVGGTGGNEVWLYEVVDGGHSWAEKDMDTSEEIWRFFGRFVK